MGKTNRNKHGSSSPSGLLSQPGVPHFECALVPVALPCRACGHEFYGVQLVIVHMGQLERTALLGGFASIVEAEDFADTMGPQSLVEFASLMAWLEEFENSDIGLAVADRVLN